MTVAGHHCQTVGGQVEVDTVHHGAQLVLRGGEDRAVQVLCQHRVGNGNLKGTVADRHRHGELVGILDGQREQTVLIADLYKALLLIDVKGDGLFRDTLHGFQQVVVVNGESSVAIAVSQRQRGAHGVLAVRGCEVEVLTIDVEHEIAQDGERVLAVDHFRKC